MIRSAVSELEFVSFAAQRQSQYLMPQTDAKDGSASHQLAHLRGLELERLRIARTVREKHPVRLERKHILSYGPSGNHGDTAPGLHQKAQDVALDSVIVGHHVEAPLGRAPHQVGR